MRYFRCDWNHSSPGDPVRIFYEVADDGSVPRTIDQFLDGRTACTAVVDFAGRKNELPGRDSLVEGDFYESSQGMDPGDQEVALTQVDPSIFQALWAEYRNDVHFPR